MPIAEFAALEAARLANLATLEAARLANPMTLDPATLETCETLADAIRLANLATCEATRLTDPTMIEATRLADLATLETTRLDGLATLEVARLANPATLGATCLAGPMMLEAAYGVQVATHGTPVNVARHVTTLRPSRLFDLATLEATHTQSGVMCGEHTRGFFKPRLVSRRGSSARSHSTLLVARRARPAQPRSSR